MSAAEFEIQRAHQREREKIHRAAKALSDAIQGKERDMRKVWVITREYSDGSAYEVLRVVGNEARAKQDLAIVAGDHGMLYKAREVDLIEEPEGEHDAGTGRSAG